MSEEFSELLATTVMQTQARVAVSMPHPGIAWLEDRFELSRGAGSSNVRSMEGLRGFAILLVFFVHYIWLVDPWLRPNSPTAMLAHALLEVGNAGVDLFFLLSGYLIFGSLIRRAHSYPHFMLRRIQRIYPAFVAVFVLYLVLSFLFPSENRIPHETGEAATYLLENFFLLPGLFPTKPMITVAWSLSYEIFFYLLLPVFIVAFAMRNWTPVRRLRFFLATSLIVFAICSVWGGPVRLAMFLAGIILFETKSLKKVPVPGAALTGLLLLAGLACSIPAVTSNLGAVIRCVALFCAFFVLCLHCFQKPQGSIAQFFSRRFLRWLGNMSYSYYLLHAIVLRGGFLVLSRLYPPEGRDQALFFLALLPAFTITVLSSAALFILIERPFSLAVSKPTGSSS